MITYSIYEAIANDLANLRYKVESRHAFVESLNEQSQHGGKKATKNIAADNDIQSYTTQVAAEARKFLLDLQQLVEGGASSFYGYIKTFIDEAKAIAPLLSYDEKAARIWNDNTADLLERVPLLIERNELIAEHENKLRLSKEAEEAARIYCSLFPKYDEQSWRGFLAWAANNGWYTRYIDERRFNLIKLEEYNKRRLTASEDAHAPNGQAEHRHYLPTTRSDLQRIYNELVEQKYIAEDYDGFFNAFNPDSTTKQGSITWIKLPKSHLIPKQYIWEFVLLMSGKLEFESNEINEIRDSIRAIIKARDMDGKLHDVYIESYDKSRTNSSEWAKMWNIINGE